MTSITQDSAVTLRYQLTSPTSGKVLQHGEMAYLHGGYDNVFPKVEAALQGHSVGYATTVELDVPDAFGPRDEALVQTIPKTQFPPGVMVGGQLRGPDAQGVQRVFHVLKIKGQQVHLDGNHPLAGQALRFGCEVVQVRPASAEEIAHRHVHGEHGHHH